MTQLHVFAVTSPVDVTHTELTRQQGEKPDLPRLADWLGTQVDTDRVELFPVTDLAPMSLGDYLASAYDIEILATVLEHPQLNTIDGNVLLVPSDALAGELAPGPELTRIATFQLAVPDNTVKPMPKAETSAVQPATDETQPRKQMSQARISGMVATAVLLFLFLFTALIVWIG